MRAKSEKRRVITETVLAAAGAICAIAIGAPAIAKPNLPSPTVQTADGPVTGTVTDTIGTFLGIPYAAPPAGSLRWMPPQPPTPWTTPLDATQFGSECPQEGGSTDEDCLFLNVYVPTKALEHARSHRYPVMFWVHGGGYTTGAGGYEDPTRLVTMGNVIVVTINYRLGALGFLAHPALSAESPYGGSGNYGIMDQQFAMQWVQQNIAAFGGNPKNVTIFGESAGGNSMFVNLVSPTAAGLFRRMIIESGSYEPVLPTLSGAEAAGMTFAGDVGCGDQTAACLRSVPVQTLLNNQPVIGILLGLVLTPNIDGYVLPESIGTALAGGDFNRVPVIDGTNHDEFRGYVALLFDLIGGPITTAEYPSVVGTLAGVIVGGNGPAILAEYPSADYPSPDLALGTWVTDYLFSCHALQADDSMVKFTQTRACEFADENAPVNGMPPVSFPYGAYHSAELQYLFGATPNPAFTSDQVELSDRMISYWTRFAKNGNPGEGWKPLSRTGDGFFESLVPPVPRRETVSAFSADHNCSFWQSLPAD